MTPHTTCPLLWDGRRFRPIADVLPDLAEWADYAGEAQ